jgi:Flp pilus assembly protein TadD
MNQPLRTSSAASIIVLASMIVGCAAPQSHVGGAQFGGKADVNVGLATRALAALNSNNVPAAIDLAERAVAKTPNDAGFRALLGNAYFAGGRFRSAEAAFRDSLSLVSEQPQIVLKLALVQIAQGKNADAIASLNAGRGVLDASDYGLALALAGRPGDAIAVLEPAARQKDADAVVRQNLALAHALVGDWEEARTIAAQDVPATQLDARMQQWMQLAKPKHASDQVAALVGVTPAAADAGQPVQLALYKSDTRVAQAQAPAPAPAPQKVATAAPVKPAFTQAAAPVGGAAPFFAVAPAPPPPHASTMAALAASAMSEAKAVLASVMPHKPAPAAAKPKRPAVAQAAVRRGNAPAVLQLGAYQSADRVLAAWTGASRKYGALKAYLPMSARFASPKGTFYRLSVRGFSSVGEANSLCNSLRRQGASCFVRNFAGDTPVQYASR